MASCSFPFPVAMQTPLHETVPPLLCWNGLIMVRVPTILMQKIGSVESHDYVPNVPYVPWFLQGCAERQSSQCNDDIKRALQSMQMAAFSKETPLNDDSLPPLFWNGTLMVPASTPLLHNIGSVICAEGALRDIFVRVVPYLPWLPPQNAREFLAKWQSSQCDDREEEKHSDRKKENNGDRTTGSSKSNDVSSSEDDTANVSSYVSTPSSFDDPVLHPSFFMPPPEAIGTVSPQPAGSADQGDANNLFSSVTLRPLKQGGDLESWQQAARAADIARKSINTNTKFFLLELIRKEPEVVIPILARRLLEYSTESSCVLHCRNGRRVLCALIPFAAPGSDMERFFLEKILVSPAVILGIGSRRGGGKALISSILSGKCISPAIEQVVKEACIKKS